MPTSFPRSRFPGHERFELQNGYHTYLFSREGGSPVWVPAFAGKHALVGFSDQSVVCIGRCRWSSRSLDLAYPAYFFFARKLLNPSISQRAPDRMRIASRSLQIIPSEPGLK